MVETRLIPLQKFNEFHKYPSVRALKKLIFDRKANGFDKVVKRIGVKKWYVDEQAFFNWVEEQNKKAG